VTDTQLSDRRKKKYMVTTTEHSDNIKSDGGGSGGGGKSEAKMDDRDCNHGGGSVGPTGTGGRFREEEHATPLREARDRMLAIMGDVLRRHVPDAHRLAGERLFVTLTHWPSMVREQVCEYDHPAVDGSTNEKPEAKIGGNGDTDVSQMSTSSGGGGGDGGGGGGPVVSAFGGGKVEAMIGDAPTGGGDGGDGGGGGGHRDGGGGNRDGGSGGVDPDGDGGGGPSVDAPATDGDATGSGDIITAAPTSRGESVCVKFREWSWTPPPASLCRVPAARSLASRPSFFLSPLPPPPPLHISLEENSWAGVGSRSRPPPPPSLPPPSLPPPPPHHLRRQPSPPPSSSLPPPSHPPPPW